MTSVSIRRFVECCETYVSPFCIKVNESVLIILVWVELIVQEGCGAQQSRLHDDLSADGDSYAASGRNIPFTVATGRYQPAPHHDSKTIECIPCQRMDPKTTECDKIQGVYTQEEHHSRTKFRAPTRPGWQHFIREQLVS